MLCCTQHKIGKIYSGYLLIWFGWIFLGVYMQNSWDKFGVDWPKFLKIIFIILQQNILKLNPQQNTRQQMRRVNQSQSDAKQKIDENPESNSNDHDDRQWKHNTNNTRKPHTSKNRGKERTRIKTEHWDYAQVLKIFTLHGEFGSQWKFMQPQFIERSANSIKNRFYTVVRTFLKLLFRYHDGIVDKLPHQISSKTILKFYESREEFAQFNDLGKNILKEIQYNLESKHLKKIVAQNKQQILQIYELIFNKKVQLEPNAHLRTNRERKKAKSEGHISRHGSMQQSVNRRSPKSSPVPSSMLDIQKSEAILTNEPGLEGGQSYTSFMLLVPVFSFMPNAQSNYQSHYPQYPHFF